MNLAQIKEKYTILDYLGEPLRKVANGYLYRAPWREDTHPSLSVTLNGKGWHDLSTDEHGNLIDLVMKVLGTSDLAQVCAAFSDITPSSSFPQSKDFGERKEKESAFARFEVLPLQSRGLFAYLTQRGISGTIAKQLCSEAHYSFSDQNDNRYLYALAFPNDNGGYELRSSSFKGSKAPKGITTHLRAENAPYVVFEGFMDMLSFATMTNGQKHNYVTLNSTVNAETAIVALKGVKSKIFLCLDNDHSGDEATEKMLVALPGSQDIRKGLMPHKDVNELLLHRRAVQKQLQENYERDKDTQKKIKVPSMGGNTRKKKPLFLQ